jgi:hypothetical protein
VTVRARQRPAAQLHSGQDLCRPGRPDPRNVRQLVVPGSRKAVDPTGLRQDGIRQIENTCGSLPGSQYRGDQLVVTERGGAEPLELLTRTIVRRNALHRTPSQPYDSDDALQEPRARIHSSVTRRGGQTQRAVPAADRPVTRPFAVRRAEDANARVRSH